MIVLYVCFMLNLRPDLSGALFLFCEKEKSGNGGRIMAPKF